MDLFPHQSTVRLKSYRDKYLFADNDEESVTQNRDGSTKNSHWTVEVIDEDCISLRSCYGKYLTASNRPSIPGMRARYLKVTQTRLGNLNPGDPMNAADDCSVTGKWSSALQWVPVMGEDGGSEIRLKTHYGNYLQSNKGPPPLGTMVTHDLPRKEGPMNKRISWQVELVDSQSDSDAGKQSESVKSRVAQKAKSFAHKGKEKIKGSAIGRKA